MATADVNLYYKGEMQRGYHTTSSLSEEKCANDSGPFMIKANETCDTATCSKYLACHMIVF